MRSALYFELLDALKAGGCPLCRIGRAGSDSYLRALIYEGVTDPPLREALRHARGLCYRHAWRQAGQRGSTVGLSIIYEDVLNTLARTLEAHGSASGPRANRPGLIKALGPAAECPACRFEREAVQGGLKTLLSSLEDPDIAAGYRSVGGLCLPHFQETLGRANDAQARTLEAWQLDAWRSLRAELLELIRKNDHRYQGEPVGAEADSWLRAIAAVIGESSAD